MKVKKLFTLLILFLVALALKGQTGKSSVEPVKLPVNWEELTAPDFARAISLSEGVCIIPMGVIEKHGPHLPLGTDVFTSREISRRAASKEYCVVFPFYLAGQIYEAMHQQGTIAYSPELIYKILDETCEEISRNGFKKILIVNGHGGNNNFVTYFCQTQLAKQKNYAVYVFTHEADNETRNKIASMRKTTTGGHADEAESSVMMLFRPELVKIDQAAVQSGQDQMRLKLNNVYTPIWWFAKYPNHYAGDARYANPELGEVIVNQKVQQLSEVIKAIKADKETLRLQNEFYKECVN